MLWTTCVYCGSKVRDIPILAQHTDEKYSETETYFEGGLRKVASFALLSCFASFTSFSSFSSASFTASP